MLNLDPASFGVFPGASARIALALDHHL